MSQKNLENRFGWHPRTAMVCNRIAFMIPFIFMVFLGQMACLGATASDSRTVREKMQDVWGCIFEADLARAEVLLGALKREHPDDLLIQTGLGYLSLEKGEYGRAEKEFINVIQLEEVSGDIKKRPDSVRHVVSLAFRGLGYVYLQQSEVLDKEFEAKTAFSKAFYAYNDIPSYIQFAVIVRKHERDFKTSEQVHQEVLKNYPKGFASNRIQLAILNLNKGKREEANKLVEDLPFKGYYAFDWAAFYSVAGNMEKTMDSLRIYLDRYCSYPARYQQILRDVKSDVDFENFRKSPQFNEWFKKAAVACGSSVAIPPKGK